jgi:integrase
MHSLINIIEPKKSKGKLCFRARFFDKNGGYIQEKSLSGSIKTRTEAYLKARKELEQVLSLSKDEIEQYGILSVDEVKTILNLQDVNKTMARDTLITLLGVTCGLGVSEIRYLRKEHIQSNDMFLVETGDKTRIIPFIGNVRKRIKEMDSYFPESKYVIPNIRNMNKPCNPISITRGVESVLKRIGMDKERNILPSCLWETFVSLLVKSKEGVDMETIDFLCGFSISTLKTEGNKIDLINNLMIKLENKNCSQIGYMNWSP